jgi:hypothetical protein
MSKTLAETLAETIAWAAVMEIERLETMFDDSTEVTSIIAKVLLTSGKTHVLELAQEIKAEADRNG